MRKAKQSSVLALEMEGESKREKEREREKLTSLSLLMNKRVYNTGRRTPKYILKFSQLTFYSCVLSCHENLERIGFGLNQKLYSTLSKFPKW
jgi:hypothetical protein